LETGALADWSYWPKSLLDLGFPVQSVLSVELAVLVELKLSLDVPLVFAGRIIPPVALGTLESYELNRFALRLGHPLPAFPVLPSIAQIYKKLSLVSMA
jgi:hypothetical protein